MSRSSGAGVRSTEPARSPRALRVPLLVASFTLLAAWALLQGQAKVLESMAPAGCTAGGPAAIQGGPGAASNDDVAEIVTGWHAFTRVSHGGVIDPMTTDCISVPATDTAAKVLDIRNADTAARVWLITDMVLFAPAYGVLLLLVLEWLRRIPDPTTRAATSKVRPRPEDPVLRAAVWLAVKKRSMTLLVVAGVLFDWTENALLLHGLSDWWRILDDTGRLTVGDLDIDVMRRFSVVKWAALLLPITVALVVVVRQLIRAIALLLRALRWLWVQVIVAALFAIAALVPDQGADALRRLAAWQWLLTLILLSLLVVVVVLTAGGVLKPVEPERVPIRTPEPHRSPAGQPNAAAVADAQVRPIPAIALVFLVIAAYLSGVLWLLVPALAIVTWAAWPKRGLIWRAIRAAVWALMVVAIAGIIWLVAWATGFRGLVIPALIVGVIGVVSVVLDVVYEFSGKRSDEDTEILEPDRPADGALPIHLQAVGRVAPCLGGAIVAAFGFATLRATAGDFAFIGNGPGDRLLLRQGIGFALTVSAGLTVLLLRRLLRWADRWTDGTRQLVLAGLVAAFVPAILLHDPDINLSVAKGIGTFGLLAVFLAGFSLIGSIAARLSDLLMKRRRIARVALPSALRLMRFKSTPVMGLLVVWALLVGTIDHHEYHAVRERDVDGTPRAPITVDQLAADFVARQPDTTASPALMVASSGGGIRAAYWTGAVLDCIIERTGPIDDPCREPAAAEIVARRRAALLLMSGISGGSLGLAEYVVQVGDQWDQPARATPLPQRWYRSRLGADFLAPTIAAWLFNDGANALLRPEHGVDRAAILERAWESTWPHDEFAGAFVAAQTSGHQPALLLNGYSVEDGCRALTSGLQTQPRRDASDCGKPVESTSSSEPAVLSTADVNAQLCAGKDLAFSTAALDSARFPYVSPAGHLAGCDGGTPIEIVDGGYRETSGASTVVELWPELDAALHEAVAAGGPTNCFHPVFVQIDNGYASDQVSGVGRGTVGQTTAPLTAIMNSAAGEESAAREASRQMFDGVEGGTWFRITTYAHPGSTAPLGWVLSNDAMNDLEDQLKVNAATIIDIRDAIDSTAACA